MGLKYESLVWGVLLLLPACGDQVARFPIDPGQGPTGGGADAGAGGSGGGSSCPTTVACPGTMSGPWCVEHLPIDPTSAGLTGVWSDGPDDVWVTGSNFSQVPVGGRTPASGFVFHWNGCAWMQSPLPSQEPGLSAVWGAAPNDVWAVGPHGTAINWDGSYWSNAPVGADVDLTSISGTSASDIWTTGGFHWDGTRWAQPPGVPALADVWAVSPVEAWATVTRPMRSQIVDVAHLNGTTWTTAQLLDPTMTGVSVHAVSGGPGVAWAVGEGELIFQFANGAWAHLQGGGGSSLGFIDVMQSGADVYTVGQDIFRRVASGAFEVDPDAPTGDTSWSVWLSNAQVWVLFGQDIVLHRPR
jgi:hypothetical protein